MAGATPAKARTTKTAASATPPIDPRLAEIDAEEAPLAAELQRIQDDEPRLERELDAFEDELAEIEEALAPLRTRFEGGDFSDGVEARIAELTAEREKIGKRAAVVRRKADVFRQGRHFPRVIEILDALERLHRQRRTIVDEQRVPTLDAERAALLATLFSDEVVAAARTLVKIERGPRDRDEEERSSASANPHAGARLIEAALENLLGYAKRLGHDVAPLGQRTPSPPESPHESLMWSANTYALQAWKRDQAERRREADRVAHQARRRGLHAA